MSTPRAAVAWATKRFRSLDGVVRFLGANLSIVFWIHCVVFLLVVILTGSRQDYEIYVRQWRVVWEGYDPWTTPIPRAPHSPNAYGPLHLIFVPLSVLHPLLPKVLFASAWLWSQKEVIERVRRSSLDEMLRLALVLATLFNPFPWVWIGVYGSNDAIVAACLTFAAVRMLDRPPGVGVGMSMALAGLLKFYPLLLLPFVSFDRGRIRWSVPTAACALFAAGMLLCFLIWGPTLLTPFAFAGGRKADFLSIYAFLANSEFSPLSGATEEALQSLDHIASYILLASLLAGFALHYLLRQGPLDGLILGYVIVLLCYKVGHCQFYLPLITIFPIYVCYLTTQARSLRSAATTLIVLGFVLGAVSIIGALYIFFGRFRVPPWLVVRQNAGLLAFFLNLALILRLIVQAVINKPDRTS